MGYAVAKCDQTCKLTEVSYMRKNRDRRNADSAYETRLTDKDNYYYYYYYQCGQDVQTDPGTHPAFSSIGPGDFDSERKAAAA